MTEDNSEMFAIKKEITIRLLEGDIVVLLVDGQREIPADIAAAQHRVGEILGLQESKRERKQRNILSDAEAAERVQELYAPGSEITVAMLSSLPGYGEHRATGLMGKLIDRGVVVQERNGAFFMAGGDEENPPVD